MAQVAGHRCRRYTFPLSGKALQQRLILFCAVTRLDVERVRRVVRALREHTASLGVLEIETMDAPQVLSAAGWSSMAVRPLRGKAKDVTALEAQLEALVQSCAAELGEPVVGLFHDAANGYARACFNKDDGPGLRAEGDAGHIMRQTATWIHVDARELADYFREQAPLPPPVPGVEDAAGEAVYVDAEPDEDDRFVERKLQEGRELIEQYRAARKSGKSP